MSKRKAPPSPPRLPEAQALSAYCHHCFANPGDPCRNYLGQAKPPCRDRGHAQATPAPTTKPRGLFDAPEAEPTTSHTGGPHDMGAEEPGQETPPEGEAPGYPFATPPDNGPWRFEIGDQTFAPHPDGIYRNLYDLNDEREFEWTGETVKELKGVHP